MGAGNIFSVQPDIFRPGHFCGEKVVLLVVFADKQLEAVSGYKRQRPGHALFLFMFNFCPAGRGLLKITLLNQLLPYFVQLIQVRGVINRRFDPFQVIQLLAGMPNQRCQGLPGPFGLVVFFEISLGVFYRSALRV
ncbi:MAG: hypothetical protein BWY65_01806 [Firmicutes bacterium ADurb.Bin373]|nr:MAG: hypothetical protein BWY65_01806 [Firmicutes bacterium ADurb.Bin373]